MTRTMETAMSNHLGGSVVRPVFFVQGQFDSGNLNLFSGIGALDWSGETWTGSGHLLQVSPAEETTDLQATGATFEISGIPTEIISIAVQEDYQGRPIKTWMGGFDGNHGLIVDPFLLFEGKMDVMTIKKGGQSVTISVTAENRLADLKKARERHYTDEDQKGEYSGDTFFQDVAGLQDREIILK